VPTAIAQTKPSEQVPPAFDSGTASDMPDATGRPDAGSGIATFQYEGETLPSLKSCVDLFPTADFQEREVFDFFGIHFEGHPDLRRILMPEDYVGWPQRRDFPIGGEPVLFTKDEVDNPGWWK
ncbi:MAG: NADH-quinone oxidoreductase subunit C, partial [Actinomycetota bacterium]|nr:NADH-quinone oxidoreductase subunit C [Actinomycetota bacterium]